MGVSFITVIAKKRLALICFTAAALALIVALNAFFDILGILESNQIGRFKNSVRIPVLMYHHFDEGGLPEVTISADAFERHIKALSDAGYTAISFDELCAYACSGAPLPELPVIITIDDGYMSVYETAYPILRKYEMTATVFIIGVFHGESLYKNNPFWQIIPHFGDSEALEMAASGVLSIQSHSYDMHQYEPYEETYREGVLRMRGERRPDYAEAFSLDFERAADQIENAVGARPFVYAYPFGKNSRLSESLLADLGVSVTLTTVPGVNTVIRDSPQSLRRLKRFNVPGDMTAVELLELINR